MPKYRIPPEKFVMNKGKRKYTKRPRCTSVYSKTGYQCSWEALEGSTKCRRHQGNPNPTNTEARIGGYQNWWTRLRALEQQHPGIIREIKNGSGKLAESSKLRWERARREKAGTLPKPPATTDKQVLTAHKAVSNAIIQHPPAPKKKFENLEPHEQLEVLTGSSLVVIHKLLALPLYEKVDGKDVLNLKVATMVKDTALRTLATRVKADRNALAARRSDKLAEILERLKGDAPANAPVVIEQKPQSVG